MATGNSSLNSNRRPSATGPSWTSYGQSGVVPPTPAPKSTARVRVVAVIGVVALAAIGLAFYFTSQQTRSEGNALYERALEFHARGNNAAAIALIREARQSVDDAKVLRRLDRLADTIENSEALRTAEHLLARSQYASARAILQRVLVRTPEHEAAKRMLENIGPQSDRSSATATGVANDPSGEPNANTAAGATSDASSPTTGTAAAAAHQRAVHTAANARLAHVATPKSMQPRPGREHGTRQHGTTSRAAANRRGEVHITSTDPGAIYIDGKATARITPTTMTLSPGAHTVEIRPSSDPQARVERTVHVVAGSTTHIAFAPRTTGRPNAPRPPRDLARAPERTASSRGERNGANGKRESGLISVAARPAGTVFIDGKNTGKLTPLRMYKISAGQHVIEVRQPDGTTRKRAITIEPRQQLPITFK